MTDRNGDYEPELLICGDCNGSGEGYVDGSSCSSCGGSGEVLEYDEDHEPEYEEYDADREAWKQKQRQER